MPRENLPVPAPRIKWVPILSELKPGDSLLVVGRSGVNSARLWGKRNGVKFRVKQEGKGYRLWRL